MLFSHLYFYHSPLFPFNLSLSFFSHYVLLIILVLRLISFSLYLFYYLLLLSSLCCFRSLHFFSCLCSPFPFFLRFLISLFPLIYLLYILPILRGLFCDSVSVSDYLVSTGRIIGEWKIPDRKWFGTELSWPKNVLPPHLLEGSEKTTITK
jgi:hypothetical protein